MLAITPAATTTRTGALALSLALHLAIIAVAARMHRAVPPPVQPRITEMFEIEPAPRALAELDPAPEPPPRAEASAPRPTTPRAVRTAAPAPIAAAPETQPGPEHEVLDFGSTLVTSTSTTTSSLALPSGEARRGAASPGASPSHGTGASDLSRAPALAGATQWRCPFPRDADAASIDHAVVTLRIDVAASGTALAAEAVSDPGHGFAQVARSCALRKRFTPALGRDGAARRATANVQVTFDR